MSGSIGTLTCVDYPHRNIRFASTEDGVDIAFWEIGKGRPLFILNNFGISHSELEWTVPSIASLYAELAEKYRVVRFDPRGMGLSGKPPGGWGATTSSGAQQGMSNREMGLDIDAVADALELDSFALVATNNQGPVAIARSPGLTFGSGFPGERAHCRIWADRNVERLLLCVPDS